MCKRLNGWSGNCDQCDCLAILISPFGGLRGKCLLARSMKQLFLVLVLGVSTLFSCGPSPRDLFNKCAHECYVDYDILSERCETRGPACRILLDETFSSCARRCLNNFMKN
jgi:hypothetical protein